MNSLPSLKRSTLWRWLAITTAVAALPPSAVAQLSYRMSIKSVEIVNWSAPKITEITAGYLVKVRVEGEWIEGNISGADVTILVDDQIVFSERQNFRDNLGTFSMNFAKDFALPQNLVAGEHTLTVKCGGGKLQCDPHSIRFHVASTYAPEPPADVPSTENPGPDAPEAPFLAFAQAVAARLEKNLDLKMSPVEAEVDPLTPPIWWKIQASHSTGHETSRYVLDTSKGGLSVALSGKQAPYSKGGLRAVHNQYKEMGPFTASRWLQDRENFISTHISPGYLTIGLQVQAHKQWNASEYSWVRQNLNVVWFLGENTEDYIAISVMRDTPAPNVKPEAASRFVENLKSEARSIATLFVAAANQTNFLPARWSGPPPDSKPSVPPPPGDSLTPPGARNPSPPPATPPQSLPDRIKQLGETSAARAAAIVEKAIPSAEGLSPFESAILAEAALTDADPATLMEELAAEETALAETASGDGLRVVDVQVSPERPNPGDTIQVTVTVHNTAATGGAAVFDLSLDDYHDGNRAVTALKRRTLAPGAIARYPLKFTAPRDYTFGGYATVDPLVFSGSELPFQVVNIKINWDGSTMTDNEIAAELRAHNPCPDSFPLGPGQLARFVALYRTDRLTALSTLERESIGADRKIQQADYEARLNDPAYQQQLQDDLDAATNTKQLAAYYSLRNLAQKWGYIHDLDLVAMLDDAVFIDKNAKVHGDVALARRRILNAVEAKQANPGAVQSLLLADPNDKSGHTQTYRDLEPVMTPALSVLGLADLGDATSTAIATKCIEDIQTAYNQLRKISRDSGTSVLTFELERDQMRRVLASARERLGRVDSPIVRDTISKATAQLDKLDDVAAQATRFQQRVKTVMGTKRAAETVGNTISNIGEIWSVYEVSEKVLARTNGGEDFSVAVGKEFGNWGAKKLLFACPLLAAADTTMSATGHILKKLGPEYWEAKGIDPTQYNASTLVDIGTGVTFAGIEDMSRIFGKRYDREAPLSAEERATLEARLAEFEARLDTTTDDELRARLLKARTNVRQSLRERR